MKWISRTFLTILIFGLAGLVFVCLINFYIHSQSAGKIKTPAEISSVESPRVAIVFGALVWSDKSLSPVLYDRVATAAELYRAGKVQKILMSGDNPTAEYDEPTAMKKAAVELGVPEADVVLDFAGRRTYDTCYRAKEIFEIKKAILVTQEFHLPRALYLCSNFGVDGIGVKANRQSYTGENYWAFREFFSTVSAWSEINIFPFEPIKGNKEPIL